MRDFLNACLEIILCFVDVVVVVLVLSGRLLAPLLSQIVDKFSLIETLPSIHGLKMTWTKAVKSSNSCFASAAKKFF